MAAIGEVIRYVEAAYPEVCWEPNDDYTAICIDAAVHDGPHGWERDL